MFTLAEIKEAHSHVRSGADFPGYIRRLKDLGVVAYDTHVTDGRTLYRGADGYSVTALGNREAIEIAASADTVQFRADLKAHQQGHTDYLTFCRDCAHAGVERWTVRTDLLTCTYFDRDGNEMLEEAIPG